MIRFGYGTCPKCHKIFRAQAYDFDTETDKFRCSCGETFSFPLDQDEKNLIKSWSEECV